MYRMLSNIRDEGHRNIETIEIMKQEIKDEIKKRKREKAEIVK